MIAYVFIPLSSEYFYLPVCQTWQLFVSAMGPPGGGRNDITSRFTRHLNIVSIDEFDDHTMNKIFTTITDWHFGNGYDPSFVKNGKVKLNSLILGQEEGSRKYLLCRRSIYKFMEFYPELWKTLKIYFIWKAQKFWYY